MTEDESFPRGGSKPKVQASLKRPREDDNLFSIGTAPKSKKAKKNKKLQEKPITEDSFFSNLNIQGTLSYNKLQEGMVILGCVRNITDFSIEVELPGLTFGYVGIARISDTFTKVLNKKLETNDEESNMVLKNMFHIGQFLPVKVLSIEEKDKGVHVECSINPRDLFDGKSFTWFKKGMLIWASIQSLLDHGYEINVGVKNCRSFLPTKNIDVGRSFSIGEPFWCVIHKCDGNNVATTLRVSSKSEHIAFAKIEEVDNFDDLIPGMQVDFVIDKVTYNGIQGKFLNDYFGHIDYTQLKDPLDMLSNYEEGNLVSGYVLYQESNTKVTYLSLRNLDPVPPPSLHVGDIVKAEIVMKGNNGVYLTCPTGEKCFITNKRLVASLSKKPNIDIQETVSAKFPIGTKHSIRILDYNHISRMYVCTVEQSLLKEKHFASGDLKPGQLINVTLESIKTQGIVVKTGHIKGFIPNLYISNVEYTENIKRKYKEGTKINARILHIDNGNVIFTLKPSQVESSKCLTHIDQAKRGDQYPGVVVHTKEVGAMVVFYDNIPGWISKKQLGDGQDNNVDPRQYFFKGQVVNFWILGVKDEKVLLGVKQPFEFKPPEDLKLYIGQRVSGIVSAVHKDSIDVKNKRGMMVGKVHSSHLSPSISLCSTFLKTYKIGDEVSDLMCIDNTTKPSLLSRKEALVITKSSRIKIKKFTNLRKGNLIRCYFLSKIKNGIYVKPLLVDFTQKILIESKNIVDKGESLPSFKPHQSMVAKIVSINHEAKEIQLVLHLSKVFDSNVEVTFANFGRHMKDLSYLRRFGQENNWELCRYQPGEQVSCKVEQLGEEGGCLVTLQNGIQGLVAPRLCSDNIQVGQNIKGVFLAENFEENFVEICLKTQLIQKINVLQDGVIKNSKLQSILAEKLLVKNDYILGVLKPSNCNKQFIYIPTHLHENDFTGCTSYYELSKLKLCLCGEVENYLVGMSKKLFLHLDKRKTKLNKKKAEKKEMESTKRINVRVPKTIMTLEHAKGGNKTKMEDVNNDKSLVEIIKKISTTKKINKTKNDENNVDAIRTNNKKEKEVEEVQNVEIRSKKRKLVLPEPKNKPNEECVSAPPQIKLSSVFSFFNPEIKEEVESSSDDEENEVVVNKKKKLTPKERAEQLRLEEERISKIEKELADSNRNPESAEQFDRLLLANPNSSEFWTKYIAFHVAATEIDKARTVAKRALEAIDITLIDERLNIWIALLNLENMLGTKESFDKTFEEALKFNDSLEIHLKTIQLLAESGKIAEMEEKVRKVRNKHKQEPKMWLEVAKIYYMLQRFQEARNLKDASLKSIQNKKTQMELILRFAVMEFKQGEEEQGAAIFETVLSNDPKKVTTWTVYVDQLVKKGRIEQARKVLERAVSMLLPVKIMKSLFLKFRMFEEQHGNQESIEAVKQSAKVYFEKVSKQLD